MTVAQTVLFFLTAVLSLVGLVIALVVGVQLVFLRRFDRPPLDKNPTKAVLFRF